jgi:hypothetical protein
MKGYLEKEGGAQGPMLLFPSSKAAALDPLPRSARRPGGSVETGPSSARLHHEEHPRSGQHAAGACLDLRP